MRLRTIGRIAGVLGARLDVRLNWNGEGLDRLLDAAHADVVENVVAALAASGWQSAVEVSFNVRGERGSVDVFACHRTLDALIVVEAKSVVPDVQATLMTLDLKARLAPEIARQLGWPARRVGRILAIADTRTSRRRIDQHEAIFAAALPARTVAVRRWLGDPSGMPIRGIWFLPTGHRSSARHRMATASRRSSGSSRSSSPAPLRENPPGVPRAGP
jgi:hypothetical protein